jgi:uncharacterized protein (DUF697 family)
MKTEEMVEIWDDQRRVVLDYVNFTYLPKAAIIGAVPIPFSDAIILAPMQIVMSKWIMHSFGIIWTSVGLTGFLVETAVVAMLGRFAARTLRANLLKCIPVIGPIAGGLINGAVAASFTGIMARVICELCYRYKIAEACGEDVELADFFNAERVLELFETISEKE